jgi:hypothetical protein
MDSTTPKRKTNPLKGKGGLVTVAGLAVLGGVIWWVQAYGPPPREPGSDPQVGEFVGIRRPETVTRVEVKGNAQPYTLAKSGDNWRLTAPLAVPATKQSVEDAVKGFLEGSVGERYTSERVSGGQLKQYGLDKPVATIVLTAGGQHVIEVGSKARQEQGLYARENGDQRVIVVPTFAIDGLRNKKPEDFRDKSALPLADADKVRTVSIQGPKGNLELAKRGSDWFITAPTEAKADSIEVSSLLSQAKDAQAQSFIANGAQDLAKYGLERPRLTFTAVDEKGTHTLLLGSETKEKEPKLYALRRGEQEVMLLQKQTFQNLDKTAADLHTREMLGFDTNKATHVTVQAPKGNYELAKKGNDWWVTKPFQAKAESMKVQNLLTSLSGPGSKFVEQNPTDLARFGLQSPQILATIELTGEAALRYFVGKSAPGKDKNYYARTSKSPAVFEIGSFIYEDINQKPDDLKAK